MRFHNLKMFLRSLYFQLRLASPAPLEHISIACFIEDDLLHLKPGESQSKA
jgi:hypothetical protein